MPCKPIETLACGQESSTAKTYSLVGIGNLLLWFFVLAVIIWFILWTVKPKLVQKLTPNGDPTNTVDPGKVLIASIVIALIIMVIFWLAKSYGKF
jgi:hypothetical protein